MNNILLLYHVLLSIMLIMSPVIFVALLYIKAPYGRHASTQWGPAVAARSGWIMMELPALLVILFCFILSKPSYAYALLLLWELHYVHRTFVFPFQLKNPRKPMPVFIVLSGMIFNTLNGFINGISLTVVHHYPLSWLHDPRFIAGIILFLSGFVINRRADAILLNLRKVGETDYKIPEGELYSLISCPNYFGEIIQWLGWAIATGSLAGFAFFIWTFANLAPRALHHHRWYKMTFAHYPKDRWALIPWVL